MTEQCQSTYTIDFHTKERLECNREQHNLGNHYADYREHKFFWMTVEEDGFYEKRGLA